MTALPTLRHQLRQARRDLDPATRSQATNYALRRVRSVRRYLRCRHLALYAGNDGELCPMPLVTEAIDAGKTVYLPVLHPFLEGRLIFCSWSPGEPLQRNRFGIEEPVPNARNIVSTRRLDLILVPLLGFDESGHRLGMGGGYYDRTFAFRNRCRAWRRPYLLGVGFELQRRTDIEHRPWDVGLDAVVTDIALRSF